MSNTIPLPATPYVLGIAGDGYSDDHCTSFPAWDDGAMYDHAAAVSAAARDCRTCKRFYDWEEKVCTQSNKNPCVNGDKHDPLPPVRLWRTT